MKHIGEMMAKRDTLTLKVTRTSDGQYMAKLYDPLSVTWEWYAYADSFSAAVTKLDEVVRKWEFQPS
jgi:hypothetical protein